MKVRKAAVAGQFYEADPTVLQQHIDDLMSEAGSKNSARPKVLVVPHAGYIYSGPTAARAYRCLQTQPDEIRRVVLFGPAHRVYLEGMAVPSVDMFATPLGNVPLDRQVIDGVTGMPGVRVSDAAHRDEHCLEVQLPFLQSLLKQFTLVPVVVGNCDSTSVAALIDTLWGGEDTLIVISTDLSHYLSYARARQADANTCRRILEKSTSLSGEEACGARALNGLMRSEHARRLDVELLDACNSGDTAGDRARVVGYGAFLLH
jgi:AmmeMemoRadiSam system protein B